MIRRLSQQILTPKGERTTEIDAGEDVKIVNANSEEILVDFPTAVREDEILVDFPDRGSSRQLVDHSTFPNSGPGGSVEDDVDDEGFLGFPTGGRKSFTSGDIGGTSRRNSDNSYREAASHRCSLPTTIEFAAESQGEMEEDSHSVRGETGEHFEKPSIWVDSNDDDDDDESVQVNREVPLHGIEEDGHVFEKPSNWVGDEESSAGDSEEYRLQILSMNRENRRPSIPETQSTRNLYSNESPMPRRQSNRFTRRCSMPSRTSIEPVSAGANPFAGGFEFAKAAAPVPLGRQGRRPSLANTTYSFEKEAANRPRARRASMDTYKPKDDYTDGLKAFGAKRHDIRHILY